MIISLTLMFGAVGYLYYMSKDEVPLFEEDKLDTTNEQKEKDDLYKDLEDLFI